MHSPLFDFIKKMYDLHFPGYTADGIKVFVTTGTITVDEYEEISGVTYTP